jgi:hypothetical protein
MGNDDAAEKIELLLRVCVAQLGPTPRFRRHAWREFQRALDPLATPKELPRQLRG